MDTYHNPNKLIRISTWANTLSWIVLAVAAVLALVQLYLNISQMQQYNQVPPLVYAFYGTNTLNDLLVGGFYFLALQAVSEGINILMDIFEFNSPPSEEEEDEEEEES
jgi:hypothetical protein